MILFGASGHGKSILDIAESKGEEITLIYDDAPRVAAICDVAVRKFDARDLDTEESWIISIGDNRMRKNIKDRLQVAFGILFHNTSSVSPRASVGQGSVVMAHAIINTGSSIGQHCIINSGAVIEHDCCLGDFVHISPNATLAGGVTVGEGTHIGIGACVIPGIKIGNWTTIGAGAVIIKDIPDGAVVVGNPGRIIKYNEIE